LGAAALLAACGSSTKTVTISSTPPAAQTTSAQTTGTPTTNGSATTSPTTSTGTSGAAKTETTRSAPGPAFTQHETKADSASAAAAVVRTRGYTANDTSEYHSDQTLRVLVGTRAGSSDGHDQLAFFFVGGRYLGTDTKQPSATVKVVSQGDTEVTLSYPLYRADDPLSSPSGGERHVTFQLNNGKLVPLGEIPPASSATGLSRN
jgi:hypothetical protein